MTALLVALTLAAQQPAKRKPVAPTASPRPAAPSRAVAPPPAPSLSPPAAPPPAARPQPRPLVRPLAPAPPPPAGEKRTALVLDVELGVRAFHRELSIDNDQLGELYPHTHPVAAAPAGKLRYFPGAHVTNGPGSWFGIYGHGSVTPGLRARLPDDTLLAIAAFDAGGGLVLRYGIPLLEVLLEAGALVSTWSFANAPTAALSVRYLAVRPSLEGRINVTPWLAFRVGGDVRILLGSGDVKTLFPRSTGVGFRVYGGVIFPIVAGFELRLDGDYEHYGFALRAEPGDAHIASGIRDQRFGGTASLAFRL